MFLWDSTSDKKKSVLNKNVVEIIKYANYVLNIVNVY